MKIEQIDELGDSLGDLKQSNMSSNAASRADAELCTYIARISKLKSGKTNAVNEKRRRTSHLRACGSTRYA